MRICSRETTAILRRHRIGRFVRSAAAILAAHCYGHSPPLVPIAVAEQAPARREVRNDCAMDRPEIDLGSPTEAQGKIPSFRSLEEEAAFWDTHDIADYVGDAPARMVTFS